MEITVKTSPEKDNARMGSLDEAKSAKPGEKISITGGYRNGKDIFIGDNDPLMLVLVYAHEAGEYMIKLNTSFLDPKKNTDGFELIGINELLDPETTIPLTDSEQETFKSVLYGDLKGKRIPFGDDIQSVSEKLVAKIAGDCLTQYEMEVHPVSQEFLYERFKHKRSEGRVDRVETDKKHRDHEFGPIVMQTYAIQLLENTLKAYGIQEQKNRFVLPGMHGSYQRGLNALSWYFRNKKNPPSNYDAHSDKIETEAENLKKIYEGLDRRRQEESRKIEEEFLEIKWEQDERHRSNWFKLTHLFETPEEKSERKRNFMKDELAERGYSI